MANEVRLWKVSGTGDLDEVSQLHLDLETRLERWLSHDTSILDPNLLVIGRQVETDFGGRIDLLCLDPVGDLVVVELKKDKTPREVTAQVLDYGSWVNGLSNEQITSIAEAYLAQDTLEVAFERQFGTTLPETLGESHRLLVVGSQIDPSSERIINYLSSTHGVNINGATFQYFKDGAGNEFLARLFVVEPSQVEVRTRAKGSSKRRPRLTYEELESLAAANGVGDLYRTAISALERYLRKSTTRSSITFYANFDGSHKAVIAIYPPESNQTDGLNFQVYSKRLTNLLALPDDEVEDLLPPNASIFDVGEPEYVGFTGFFANEAQINQFLSAFARMNKGRAEAETAAEAARGALVTTPQGEM
jgi:hypothetical protein